MPNHIKNRIELIGSIEEIDSMIKKFGTYHKASIKMTHDNESIICKGDGDDFNFCWWSTVTGRSTNRGDLNCAGLAKGFTPELNESFTAFPDFEKVIPPPNDPAYKDLPSQDVARHSPNWWHTWNVRNWGSKWGGYSFEREAINVFTYETAWSSSPIIIESISRQYPNVTIKYSWADEGTGYHTGRQVYHNGLIEEIIPKGGSVESYQLAFELRPDIADRYKLVDGKYEYVEED